MKSIVISPSGSVAIKDLNGWGDFKAELGDAYLEPLYLSDGVVAYVDEDGKSKGLPENRLATAIVKFSLAQDDRTLLPGDCIVGSVIFVGLAPSQGPDEWLVECSLPVEFVAKCFQPFMPEIFHEFSRNST